MNPKNDAYPNYGGRGIKVCERWNSFPNFAADMGPRPAGYTLERINNDLGYEPSNCRWIKKADQPRNTRWNRWIEFRGKRMILEDWAREVGIGSATIRRRLRVQGWTLQEALTTPVNGLYKHKS